VKTKIILLFFFTLNIFPIKAQNNYCLERQRIEDSIVVLSDKDQLLPLKMLDSLKILIVSDGTTDYKSFNETFKKYCDFEFTNIEKLKNENLQNINKYNLLILITDTIYELNYYKPITDLKIRTVFTSFTIYNSLIDSNFKDNFNSIILAFGKNRDFQDLTAQLIFGGIGAKNKLYSDLNDYYLKGSGNVTKGNIRFKYTTPYELNIDSALITQKIDSIVNDGIKNFAFPGCQILIAKDNKVFFQKSYGYQTYDSLIEVDNSTIYDLASITKIVAPLPCLMKLYDEQKFDVNEELSEYWKPFRKSNKSEMTVKEVLTHQAQLKAWIPFWKNLLDENGKYINKTIKQDSSGLYNIKIAHDKYLNKNYYKKVFKQIKNSPLEDTKKYVYSDLSFYLFPTIIENLAKVNYEEYLYNNFYNILGCNSMKYNPLQYFQISKIAPTEIDTFFRKEPIHGRVHDEGAILLNGISGHAGMFSNANDLAKIMQMYLNYGEYGGYRFISDSTLKNFTSYQFPELNNRRGLGFDKPSIANKQYDTASADASDLSFGHTGFTGTFTWVDPENGMLIVFLSNRVYPSRENKNLMKLNIRTQIHQVIYDALKDTIH
jgi:CubicO group peptidase (beta-lactamase class C family)